MKKRINLLLHVRKYKQYDELFARLRLSTFVSMAVFFLITLLFLITKRTSDTQYASLLTQKNDLAQYLLQHKDKQAQYIYFGGKLNQISHALKDDANFYPYYNVLNDILKSSSPEAQFDTLDIDKQRNVVFSVKLTDYDSLLSFLRFTESDNFLKSFKQLTITSFTIADNSSSYKLSFKGVFNPINENKN